MTSNGRVARLTALALATGTLVAAGAGTAGAASTTTTTYQGSGLGQVIALEVNLPVALPVINSTTLTQGLVATTTNALSGQAPAAIGQSMLGVNGTLPLNLSNLLDRTVTAELGGKESAGSDEAAGIPGLLSIGLLQQTSKVTNPNVAGVTSLATSKVADIELLGDSTNALNAVLAQLTGLLDVKLPVGGTGATGGATEALPLSIKDVVNLVESNVLDLAKGTPAEGITEPVKAQLEQLAALIDSIPTVLNGQIKALAKDPALLSVDLIESSQSVVRHASSVSSTTTNKLVGISALGGLVTVDGLTSSATAILGDDLSDATPNAAKGSVLKVNVADLLTVELNNKLQAILGEGVVPAEVTTVVNELLATVTGTLTELLGVSLTPGATTTNTATANTAEAATSAATLAINPTIPGVGPLFDKPLLVVDFAPAQAKVVKAQAVVPPTVVNTVGQPAATPDQALARTGAELPLTGAVAATLLGLAAVARRRRMLEQ
jgi:hypothetical protein